MTSFKEITIIIINIVIENQLNVVIMEDIPRCLLYTYS